MKPSVIIVSIVASLIILAGCRKQWLDAKSDKSQVVPSTLNDMQAILDNDTYMNGSITSGGGTAPSLGEMSCDDYYLIYSTFTSRPEIERNAYTWEKDVYAGAPVDDWNLIYRSIFHANIVLDGLKKIEVNTSNAAVWNNCKGSALFYRALGFYNIAQVFCKAYDPATASNDLGIPLRLDASVTTASFRSSVQETYERVINDLHDALELVPQQPLFKTRPGKAAVNALMARVFLSMGDYSNALNAADACLGISNTLMDYNNINGALTYPFPLFNEEVIFYNRLISYTILNTPRWKVDTALYKSYDTNDKRRALFFKTETDGTFTFRGDYNGAAIHFGGLAVDEMYCIKAECLVRLNKVSESLSVLNTLLQKRWVTGTFTPVATVDANEALSIILRERRKELPLRGLRWTDLRRLNKEPQFAVTIRRILNGVEYLLPPNDSRYVFPIPDEVIALTSMQQNER